MTTTLNSDEIKEIMSYIDDFLYHMEDNYGIRMETDELLKSLNLVEICGQLNHIYAVLDSNKKS